MAANTLAGQTFLFLSAWDLHFEYCQMSLKYTSESGADLLRFLIFTGENQLFITRRETNSHLLFLLKLDCTVEMLQVFAV